MDHFEEFLNKCHEGDLSAIESFLSEGISPNVQNAEGETALQISAANGYLDVIKSLLSKGATVDLSNNYGWTPLMHATKYGHIEVVSVLIQMKAKVNISNRLGLRPIDLAAWSGNVVCLKLIMEAGAIIDNDKSLDSTQSYLCDISPLIAASLQGYDFVIRTLIEKGSPVNQVSPITGLTPLMLAAYSGHKSAVEILMEFGGDANKTDVCGRTALDLAGVGGKKDVIMFLEEFTLTASRKLSGEIPHDMNILRVVRSGDIAQVKALLQLNRSLCNYSDPEDGVTPLMTACMVGLNDIAELLISKGADINAQDITNGWTPLMYAVFHRQAATVHLLLKKGVDIDVSTANGYTAFDLAIHTDNSQNNILNTLLEYSGSEGLLDAANKLASFACSTAKQSHLTIEKIPSRGDSQSRFKDLLGGFSSHLRQFSKSSAVSPTPDLEIFDETLSDVFFDDDVAEASTKKNFLCLSKFYAPNQQFAHLVKEQVVEALCLPPLPGHKSSVDLARSICPKKDNASKSMSVEPRFNSLRVPNLLRKIKLISPVCSDNISEDSESLSVQEIGDFSTLSSSDLRSVSSLQQEGFEFKTNNSGSTGPVSACSTLKYYSELNEETSKNTVELSYKNSEHENDSILETDTGGLTALLSEGSLTKYAKKFRDEEIDLECFKYLTEDDLEEMGIHSFNSRHKLMEIIDKLKKT